MRNLIVCFLVGTLTFFSFNVHAEQNEFKKNNPDGKKYVFVRSYISALGYFYNIEQHWKINPTKKKFAGNDLNIIRESMDYLVLDNSNLRISKNYMISYLDAPNSIMRKISDLMITACNQDIDLNNQSKNLWAQWLVKKVSGRPSTEEEKSFVKAQQSLDSKRIKSDELIVEASMLLTKVVLSESNADERGYLLAITEKQRNKLIDNLDVYGKNVTDWGYKRGQTSLEASIAIIREVLEDPIYIALPAGRKARK